MSQPFIGQLAYFGFNFPPVGWAPCDGRLLLITQYTALFSLIGTTYGGDGQTTFAVPDLRGRLPVHQGQGPGLSNYVIGQKAGVESVTLASQHLPSHSHSVVASATNPNASPTATPGNSVSFATGGGSVAPYAPNATGATAQQLAANSINIAGASQAHNNMMPITVGNICICLEEIGRAHV